MAAHLSTLRTLAVGALVFPPTVVVAYHLAVWVARPRTSDGRLVMPLGQGMLALAVGVLASVIAMIVDRHLQHRAIERAYGLDQLVPQATAREAPRKPAP